MGSSPIALTIAFLLQYLVIHQIRDPESTPVTCRLPPRALSGFDVTRFRECRLLNSKYIVFTRIKPLSGASPAGDSLGN